MLQEHKEWSGDTKDTLAAAEHLSPTDRERRQQTLIFLNYYELIAIGIRKKAIHEGMYKTWLKTGYVRTWKLSEAFVEIWRSRNNNSNPDAYINFEYVADAWDRGKDVQ